MAKRLLRRSHTLGASDYKLKEIEEEEVQAINQRIEKIKIDTKVKKTSSTNSTTPSNRSRKSSENEEDLKDVEFQEEMPNNLNENGEFDSWGAIRKKCAAEKSKRKSLAEPEKLMLMHMMSTGFTSFP